MTIGMRIPCLLAIQAVFLCSNAVLSLEDPRDSSQNDSRPVRKRIDENGQITNDVEDNIESGRQYLESLWDSLEKNNDKKLEQGRMRYLASMMSMLPMSMVSPTNEPTMKAPSTPVNGPTQKPITPSPETTPTAPTPAPIRGPTLPTRFPIPTKPPTPAPSTAQPTSSAEPTAEPIEVPVVPELPPTRGTFIPTGPCIESEKDAFLLEVVSRITEASIFLDNDTPQGMAYSFLREEDPSFICSPTLIQRYGLSTLYFAMGGAGWTNNEGWLGSSHECNWYGVDCNEDKLSTSLNLGTYTK